MDPHADLGAAKTRADLIQPFMRRVEGHSPTRDIATATSVDSIGLMLSSLRGTFFGTVVPLAVHHGSNVTARLWNTGGNSVVDAYCNEGPVSAHLGIAALAKINVSRSQRSSGISAGRPIGPLYSIAPPVRVTAGRYTGITPIRAPRSFLVWKQTWMPIATGEASPTGVLALQSPCPPIWDSVSSITAKPRLETRAPTRLPETISEVAGH